MDYQELLIKNEDTECHNLGEIDLGYEYGSVEQESFSETTIEPTPKVEPEVPIIDLDAVSPPENETTNKHVNEVEGGEESPTVSAETGPCLDGVDEYQECENDGYEDLLSNKEEGQNERRNVEDYDEEVARSFLVGMEDSDNKKYDSDGYNERGFDRYGIDQDGFDRSGFNKEGFDREGYNKRGYDREGIARWGFDRDGYNRDGYNRAGYDRSGYNIEGYDRFGYDKGGYNIEGYDRFGYDKGGYNIEGYDRFGYDKGGYNRTGYDRSGYDRGDYNSEDYDRYGYNKDGYDRHGYDQGGYGRDGYDRNGYDRNGYDAEGTSVDCRMEVEIIPEVKIDPNYNDCSFVGIDESYMAHISQYSVLEVSIEDYYCREIDYGEFYNFETDEYYPCRHQAEESRQDDAYYDDDPSYYDDIPMTDPDPHKDERELAQMEWEEEQSEDNPETTWSDMSDISASWARSDDEGWYYDDED